MRCLWLGLAVWLVAFPAQGHAGSATDTEKAKKYFSLGLEHTKRGDHDEAIADFRAGYDLDPRPLFLYNIAQCARAAGYTDLAVENYRRYIAAETEVAAPQLEDAAQWLKRLSPPASAPSQAAPSVPSPAPPAEPPQSVATHAAPSVTKPEQSSLTTVALPPKPTKPPLRRRGWFWGAIAGAAAAVGLGIGLGVGLGRSTTPQPSRGTLLF